VNAAEQMKFLRSPGLALPRFAEVLDQETSTFVKYDPYRLTDTLQYQVLAYYDDPPRTDFGQTKWLTVLTARQMGKSLVAEYGAYCKTAYTPGMDHVCIADIDERAKYLHKRVHQMHTRWPEEIKSPTLRGNELLQLTFDPMIGGKMRVLSAETGAVGIGQSPDSFHASEAAFWSDFAGTMSMIYPSMMNRANCLAVFECTPWLAGNDWHEHVVMAREERGRHTYLFRPFWDGVLNRRQWLDDWAPDQEELRLLNEYHPQGLRLSHLAFRRNVLDTDAELRRNPELFKVFYPFDDVTCWITGSNSAIPAHALEKHKHSGLLTSKEGYYELRAPEPDGRYVIGVDPCGHASRDHAAFQVLQVTPEGWYQVAWFADHADPVVFTRKLQEIGLRYRRALVAVENNGVGQAVLALLRDWEYPNIYYDTKGRPGITTTGPSLDQMTAQLIDALMDELTLHDKRTIDQLMTYKHDKRIEENVASELVRGNPSKRRRERHHWDSVSALMFAVVAARVSPRGRRAPKELPAGDSPIHSGLYRADVRAREWEEMQRRRRALARKANPWYK
jgi:hypothetical protein